MAASTRQRLTEAALELFLTQGVSATTTRQVADAAQVNEATLFRNFGNKYGLLLTLLEDSGSAVGPLPSVPSPETLRTYADDCLRLLEKFPNFVRSVVGESDQYLPAHRQALRARLSRIQADMARQVAQLIDAKTLPADDLASVLGALLVGYAVLKMTSGYALWSDREAFLDALVAMLTEASATGAPAAVRAEPVNDLPAAWVHQAIKQARTVGLQDGALALVLFGAGLRPAEVIALARSHHTANKSQHVLRVGDRQVPVNQWILGKRYGSYTSNLLTKWLKKREDSAPALFVNSQGQPLTLSELKQRWQSWWQGIDAGPVPQLEQARQTWCVEMLMRGIGLEDLGILAGCPVADLRPCARRAREKSAIAAATQLDRKTPATPSP